MYQFEMKTNDSTDDALRERLYVLFERTFGIEVEILQDFYARGFWNPTYRPYTLFDGERAVANASRFSMPLLINGETVQAVGIQSVMTDPEYRSQGLMKNVFAKLLDEVDREAADLAFLQTERPELYTPFGFRLVRQHHFVTAAPSEASEEKSSRLRKLDFFLETGLVKELFRGHQPISNTFASLDYQSSFYLNMYDPGFHEKLYYAEDLHVLLVCEVQDGVLKLYDVVGPKLPTLTDLCAQIPEAVAQVEFHFTPDRFCADAEPVVSAHQNLMVRGRFALENGLFRLQKTAAF